MIMRFILIYINDSMTNSTARSLSLKPVTAAVQLALAACFAGNALAQTAPAEKETTLQEVKVIGTQERSYEVKTSSTATKTDTLLRDTPQAITVVTKELMQDQAMQSMADVIRYVPGVVTAQGEGNRDTAVFRGNSSTSDFYVDGIRDDVQYYRDFYNIDRVEALKGSNAMIFGRGGSGGVINRVSKQPEWNAIREASLTLGSWSNRRATVDLGQAVNDQVAVRVNAMAEDAGSYRDNVNARRAGINPTVAVRAGANTFVVLGYEHFRDDRTADRGITAFNGRPVDVDPATFMGNPELSNTWSRVDAFTAAVDHDFGNGLTLRNRTRYADYDKFYQNVFAASLLRADGTLDISGYNNATQRKNLINQTDFNYSIDAGAIKHKLAFGLELGRQQTDNLRNTAYNSANSTTTSVPLSAPYVTGPLSFRPSATDANNHGVATVASVYLQDQVELSREWQAVLGLRYDRFNVDFNNKRDGNHYDITDTPLSPRVGLVYKPFEAMSLYGSYSVSFVPRAGEQLGSLSPSNSAFDPEKFRNIELGAKWDIRPDLAFTAAVYKLDRSNVVIPGPVGSNISVLADGQVSKGVELGLSGNVSKGWSVMGGYAYQDAKLTATQSATAKDGATLAQVPRHTLSLWNRVDLTPGFAAALGLVYRDSIFSSTSNAVELPAFTRVDGALFYTIDKQYRVQLNVENMFDKKYYAAANSDTNITPGSPRAFKVTLNAKF
jgi:catecholate siderophore receptor